MSAHSSSEVSNSLEGVSGVNSENRSIWFGRKGYPSYFSEFILQFIATVVQGICLDLTMNK